MLLDYKPYWSVSNIVHHIKQVSTYKIWQDCPDLKDIYYGEKHLLQSRGYFVRSVGDVGNDTIKGILRLKVNTIHVQP